MEGGYSEQTIIAAAVKALDGVPFDDRITRLSWDDRYSILPSFLGQNWTLRHYVGPSRHMFWRDAIFLWIKKWMADCKSRKMSDYE